MLFRSVDGAGIRFTVCVQGCPHNCPNCHNTQTHDIKGGYDCSTQKIYDEVIKDPLLKGITLSGGEPMEQAESLLPLAKAVAERGLDITIFSGYTLEQLLEKGKETPEITELISLSRLLVDGPFIESKKDLTLLFRGSSNQRLINPKASLEQKRAIEYSENSFL